MAQQQDMGLFGVSPQDILAQQQKADQELAMRQAQLAPGQGLMYQAASAGQRAGRSIAGLFGIEDPALKEATQMDELKKAVASQWDGSDPEKALELFVQEANKRGFTSQALKASEKLTDLRMKKEEKESIIGLRKAQTTEAQRKGEAALKEKLTSPFGKVDPDKFTPESLALFQETGNYKDLVQLPKDKVKFSDPYPMQGADGKQILVQRNLDTGQIEPIDKASRVSVSATAGTALPKNLKAIGEVRQDFLRTIDPNVKAYNSASTSETMFDQALAGNFQGWRAAITQLAKSVGDSQISAREIDAYGLDPSLVGNIVDKANTLLTGTPSRDTILGAKKIATAIKNINQQRARKEQEVYLDLATKAEGYSPEARRYFDLPFLAPGTDTGTNQKTTSRGTRYTVE
ncbi:MAG: hypothetical protein EBR82_33475 [Caulobacteraceae bacterium]|nr:hypothetical protein [Caulobacteraceae bacterium]